MDLFLIFNSVFCFFFAPFSLSPPTPLRLPLKIFSTKRDQIAIVPLLQSTCLDSSWKRNTKPSLILVYFHVLYLYDIQGERRCHQEKKSINILFWFSLVLIHICYGRYFVDIPNGHRIDVLISLVSLNVSLAQMVQDQVCPCPLPSQKCSHTMGH